MRLCVGDDWTEDHHDIEVTDQADQVLARRVPEGVAGLGQLHELIGRFVPADGDAEVQVGIETDRGPWVAALIAAGYTVFPVNRCRRRGTGAGTACPGPRATAATRTCWLTWCYRCASAAPGGRWQPAGRGRQGAGPHAQDADLGAVRGGAAAAGELGPAMMGPIPGPERRVTRPRPAVPRFLDGSQGAGSGTSLPPEIPGAAPGAYCAAGPAWSVPLMFLSSS
jgi:Transposase